MYLGEQSVFQTELNLLYCYKTVNSIKEWIYVALLEKYKYLNQPFLQENKGEVW